MQIKTSENLIKLAKLFNSALYITGGYVRNCLLNLKTSDIDICGAKTTKEVIDLLQDSEFVCKNAYPRMGTLKILCKTGESFEYTAFREEEYNFGHTPKKVKFVDDIGLDAKRRDFKINAVYYDILSQKIVDPAGGLQDIENREISCVIDPDEVFKFDGLRLLRLVRFSAELNFKIERKTYLAAIKNSEKLSEIFKTNSIKSVEVVRMEVPCCTGIFNAVKTALAACGKDIDLTSRIIGTDGVLK